MVSKPAVFLAHIPVVRNSLTNVTLCTFVYSMYCRRLRGRGRGTHVRGVPLSHVCGATRPRTPINDTYYILIYYRIYYNNNTNMCWHNYTNFKAFYVKSCFCCVVYII